MSRTVSTRFVGEGYHIVAVTSVAVFAEDGIVDTFLLHLQRCEPQCEVDESLPISLDVRSTKVIIAEAQIERHRATFKSKSEPELA